MQKLQVDSISVFIICRCDTSTGIRIDCHRHSTEDSAMIGSSVFDTIVDIATLQHKSAPKLIPILRFADIVFNTNNMDHNGQP